MNVLLVRASADDAAVAYTLTRELMEHHNALDIFTLTEERLGELIKTEAVCSYIALADSKPAGIMNFFWKYTTFSGRKILYIEDFYVRESFRGTGLGRKLLEKARELAAENDCEQIELKCALWNENAAHFYEKMGLKPENDWNVYTLSRTEF